MCVGVKRLAKMGMVESAPGMSALDMNTAEDMVVRNTREVVPGMIICGMEVSDFSLSVANWLMSVLVRPTLLQLSTASSASSGTNLLVCSVWSTCLQCC